MNSKLESFGNSEILNRPSRWLKHWVTGSNLRKEIKNHNPMLICVFFNPNWEDSNFFVIFLIFPKPDQQINQFPFRPKIKLNFVFIEFLSPLITVFSNLFEPRHTKISMKILRHTYQFYIKNFPEIIAFFDKDD